MDKLRIPPMHAIKLAYRLRSETAKKPPEHTEAAYLAMLRAYKREAKERGYTTAHLRLAEMLAERADEESVNEVACAYIERAESEDDVTRGLKMLREAASAKNIHACLSLAKIYLVGRYVKKSVEQAVSLYTAAGEMGSAFAYEAIGDVYSCGKDTDPDVAGAMDYYDLAIALGSEPAREKSERIKKEREEIYREALEKEKTAPDEAFMLYNRACAMGHVAATYKMGYCLENGIGTEINRRGAFLLYNKASELSDTDALVALGVCYASGIGTRLDYRRAKEILSHAERIGATGAGFAIRTVMERKKAKLRRRYYSTAMRLIHQKKVDIAKAYLDVSAELGFPRAIYTLGCLYEFGMGAVCDKERAFALYEKAYAMRFRDPRAEYKLAVLRMLKTSLQR